MPVTVITPPTEPITLVQAKQHLRVDHSDDDDLITALISAVRLQIDAPKGWLNLALPVQTLEITLDTFPCNEIKVPWPPLRSVVSIKYDDPDGIEQTLSPTRYSVDARSQPGWILPDENGWPSTSELINAVNAVRVRFECGHDEVPAPIMAWMLLNIGSLYANRETIVIGQPVASLPGHILNMLSTFRAY